MPRALKNNFQSETCKIFIKQLSKQLKLFYFNFPTRYFNRKINILPQKYCDRAFIKRMLLVPLKFLIFLLLLRNFMDLFIALHLP